MSTTMEQGILGSIAKYNELLHQSVLEEGVARAIFEAVSLHGSMKDDDPEAAEIVETFTARTQAQGIALSMPLISEAQTHQLEDLFRARLSRLQNESRDESLGQYLCLGHAAGLFHCGCADHLVKKSVRRINLVFQSAKVDEKRLFKLIKDLPVDRKSMTETIWALKTQLHKCHDVIRILFLSAVPEGGMHLRTDKEHKKLKQSVEGSNYSHGFEVADCHCCTLQDVSRNLQTHQPTILHFSGHATEKGLYFETEDGKEHIVETSQLIGVLKLARESYGLRTVILNACATHDQSVHIAEAVGRVIAMKGTISDRAAIKFTDEFYHSLVRSSDVDEAFKWSFEISQMDRHPESRPVLIVAGQKPESPRTSPSTRLLPSANPNRDIAPKSSAVITGNNISSSAEQSRSKQIDPSSNPLEGTGKQPMRFENLSMLERLKHRSQQTYGNDGGHPSGPVKVSEEQDFEVVSSKAKESMKVDALSMLEKLKCAGQGSNLEADKKVFAEGSDATEELSMIEKLGMSQKPSAKPAVVDSRAIPMRGGQKATQGPSGVIPMRGGQKATQGPTTLRETAQSTPTSHTAEPSGGKAGFDGTAAARGYSTNPKSPHKPTLFHQHPFFDDPFFKQPFGNALFDDIMMAGLFGPSTPSSGRQSQPAEPSPISPADQPTTARNAFSQPAAQRQTSAPEQKHIIVLCDLCYNPLTEDGGLICADCNGDSKIACIRCIPDLPCIRQRHDFVLVKINY